MKVQGVGTVARNLYVFGLSPHTLQSNCRIERHFCLSRTNKNNYFEMLRIKHGQGSRLHVFVVDEHIVNSQLTPQKIFFNALMYLEE